MYIWRVNRLVEDLRADQVTEAESLKYLIFVAIICTISTDPVFAIGIEYSIFDALITLVLVIGVVFGTYYCYRKNQSGDNRDFIRRFVCLSVPVGIRLIPVVLILGMISGILFTENWPGIADLDEAVEEPPQPYITAPEDFAVVVILEIIFYWYLSLFFSKVANTENTESNA